MYKKKEKITTQKLQKLKLQQETALFDIVDKIFVNYLKNRRNNIIKNKLNRYRTGFKKV